MEPVNQETNRDFSIIFKEIEKINKETPSFRGNLVNDADLQHEEAIRAFGEMCQEINSAGNNPTTYLTFS